MRTLFVLFFLISLTSNCFAVDCSLMSKMVENISEDHNHIETSTRIDSRFLLTQEEVIPFLNECVIPAFKAKGFWHAEMESDRLSFGFKSTTESPEQGLLAEYKWSAQEKHSIVFYMDDSRPFISMSTVIHELAHAWDVAIRNGEDSIFGKCSIDKEFKKLPVEGNRFGFDNFTIVTDSHKLLNHKDEDRPTVYSNLNDKEFMAEVITAIITQDAWVKASKIDSIFSTWNKCRLENIQYNKERKQKFLDEMRKRFENEFAE
jgi:nucleoside-triphosphatase THEP1